MQRRMLTLSFCWVSALTLLAACGGGGGGNPQPQNQAPSAVFSLSLESGPAPLEVSFNAAASSDSDGSIVTFRWDFDGDGAVDLSSASAQASFLYPEPGEFSVRLQVVDDDGAAGQTERALSVAVPSFSREQISAQPQSVANSLDLAIVEGRPAVCFTDRQQSLTMFARAEDAQGSSWPAPVLAFTEPSGDCDLLLVDGRPALLLVKENDGRMAYVRADDALGSAWSSPVLVAPLDPNLIALKCELLLAEGRPAALLTIEPSDQSSADALFYLRADDAQGAVWSAAPLQLSQPGENLGRLSMGSIGGRPAAAYIDGDFRYRQATDAAGSQWPLVAVNAGVVDGDIDGPLHLFEADGRPNIVFSGDAGLRLLQAADDAGSSWNALRQISVPGSAEPEVAAAASILGRPALLLELDNGILALLLGRDAAGLEFAAPLNLNGDSVLSADLIELAGRPACAYQDSQNFSLRFALAD